MQTPGVQGLPHSIMQRLQSILIREGHVFSSDSVLSLSFVHHTSWTFTEPVHHEVDTAQQNPGMSKLQTSTWQNQCVLVFCFLKKSCKSKDFGSASRPVRKSHGFDRLVRVTGELPVFEILPVSFQMFQEILAFYGQILCFCQGKPGLPCKTSSHLTRDMSKRF